MIKILLIMSLFAVVVQPGMSENKPEKDSFSAQGGDIVLTFFGHGTLMIDFAGTVVHVDPVGEYADYTKQPKADIILITHEHGDHLDQKAVAAVSKKGTTIILNKSSYEKLGRGTVMDNGDERSVDGIDIEAVPAYNTTAGREHFHPKGRDNGYILTALGKRIYIAGDTEVIPEMSRIDKIDIAFLPMNQPYTMTPEQAAEAAEIIGPKILYPYHFGNTDTEKLLNLLSDSRPAIEVRVRNMQ